MYTCNTCQKSVETRYHCTVCDDFDLCVACYQKDGHPHKMEKLGFDLDGGGGDATAANNPQVAKAASRTVDPDPHGKKNSWIRIRKQLMWIHSPG